LVRVAQPASASNQTRKQIAVAISRGEGGPLIRFGPEPQANLDHFINHQVPRVGALTTPSQPLGWSRAPFTIRLNRVSYLEEQRIAALTEPNYHNLLAWFGILQCIRQNQEGVSCSSIPAPSRQIVANTRVRQSQPLSHHRGDAREHTWHAEVCNFCGRHARLSQERPDEARHQFQITLLAKPSLLPLVVEFLTCRSEVVNEVNGV
jgi:hypothetical protein